MSQFLLISLTVLAVVLGTAEALGGRGSKTSLALIAAKSSDTHPLHSTQSATIWCTPDNPQVVIKSAYFIRTSDKKRFDATLNPTKKNATYTFAQPTVKDAGEYQCELDTPHGKISHRAFIYSRPVAHTLEHFTAKEGHDFFLESAGVAIDKGQSVNLTCPVNGYPKPTIRWVKDGAPLKLTKTVTIEGSTVKIVKAEYSDSGSYSCEAINEYSVDGTATRPLLVVERVLDVHNEYQWVYPLAVIVVILTLLVIIIVICEFRNKKRATK